MKQTTLIFLFCCSCLLSYGQDAIESHFSEYQSNDDFTSIFISQKMFGMISNISVEEKEGEELMEVLKDLTGLRILTSDLAPAGFFKTVNKKLTANKYELLMTVKEDDQEINFLIMEEAADKISELVLLTGEGSKVVMISFLGNLDLNKISKLSKTLDIDGSEHLEKLKETQINYSIRIRNYMINHTLNMFIQLTIKI